MANVYFFDKELKQSSISDPNAFYAYIEDVDEFKDLCGDNWESEGVDDVGCYTWSNTDFTWKLSTLNDRMCVEREIKKIKESTGGITRPKGDVFVGWNIVITLDSGEVIKTNSEPVDMNEVQEAINVMLKPSFFGKRIKKFEIVAE